MYDAGFYAIAVFIIILISGCAVNLLKNHFIIQLTVIAFFFTYAIFKSILVFQDTVELKFGELYALFLPMFMGISACLVSMVLGFWIFPHIRRKFKA